MTVRRDHKRSFRGLRRAFQGGARIICAMVLVAIATGAASRAPVAESGRSAWQVAITIDDVPMTGGGACTVRAIENTTRALLDQLAAHRVRATAFVIPGTPCHGGDASRVLEVAARWRAAGHDIGNHSWSHRDYNGLDADTYLSDVARAHRSLEPLLRASHQQERWFRAPLLHTGQTDAKHAALIDWLARQGYRMGAVTIDNQEWVFAAAYQRALGARDSAVASSVVDAYLAHLAACVTYYRGLSADVFGRDIPQVLLLHANRLNADHIGRVLVTLSAGGAQFVSLTEATRDPAYAAAERYVGPRGLSWLQRGAQAAGVPVAPEPREPAWITAASSAPDPPDPREATAADTVSAAVAAALDSANAAFSAAWLRGEGPALAAAYTADGILHPPAGGVLVGQAAIRGFWRPATPGRRLGHRLEPRLRRHLGEGHVLEMGRWHSRAISDAIPDPAWVSGCYTVVWSRGADGRWRLEYDGWTDAREPDWACRPRE